MKKDHGPELARLIKRAATQSFAKLLLEAGDNNPVIEGDYNALTYSADCGNYQSIAVLAQRHVDFNAPDAAGRNALQLAYHKEWTGAFDALLEGGADPATRTSHGYNMLERIATTGNTDWGNRVTKHVKGSALDTRDADGNTPLLLALKHARHGVALAYIEAGADPYASNNKGENCIGFAREYYFQPVFDALAKATKNRGLARAFNDVKAAQHKQEVSVSKTARRTKKQQQPGTAN